MPRHSFLATLVFLIEILLYATGCSMFQPAPELSLHVAGRNCGSSIDLDSAWKLDLDERAQSITIDSTSACVAPVGAAPETYVAIKMPPFTEPYWLTVDSVALGETQFAPQLLTVSSNGKLQRIVPFEEFRVRGKSVQGSIFVNRENADETHIVIMSSSDFVGTEARQTYVQQYFFPVPISPGFLYTHHADGEQKIRRSFNGRIKVRARSKSSLQK